MSLYRRFYIPGGSYFFTVVTHERRPVLCDEPFRRALRRAINEVRSDQPFAILAWVLLPDHLHTIWTLPPGDDDFSKRWGRIKALTTKALPPDLIYCARSVGKLHKREAGVWQRRFWEHALRSEDDLRRHADYLHYNPAKHGLVEYVADWPWSSFHRWVKQGLYPSDWALSVGKGPETFVE